MSLSVPVAGRGYICDVALLEGETYGWSTDEVGVVVIKVMPRAQKMVCNVLYRPGIHGAPPPGEGARHGDIAVKFAGEVYRATDVKWHLPWRCIVRDILVVPAQALEPLGDLPAGCLSLGIYVCRLDYESRRHKAGAKALRSTQRTIRREDEEIVAWLNLWSAGWQKALRTAHRQARDVV